MSKKKNNIGEENIRKLFQKCVVCSKFAKYYGVLRKIPDFARSAVSPLAPHGLNHTQTSFLTKLEKNHDRFTR